MEDAMAQTVRVSEATHRRVRDLAVKLDQPLARVLDAAVREYERTIFWEQYRRDVEALNADASGDASGRAVQEVEDRLWDRAAADGLEREEEWTDANFAGGRSSSAR